MSMMAALLGRWRFNGGALKVSLPQNNFGLVLVKEVPNTITTPVTHTVQVSRGVLGVTISFIPTKTLAAASTLAERLLYVAFGGTVYDDVTTANKRYIVPLGETRTFSFDADSVTPLTMTLVADAAGTASGDTLYYYEMVTL